MATMTHVDGSMEEADPDAFGDLLDELSDSDDEHPDVAVGDEDAWSLSVFPGNKVVWENLDENEPRWARLGSRDEVLKAMRDVLTEERSVLEGIDWSDGYGS